MGQLLDAYDAFLAILNDKDKRSELETLKPKDAYNNQTFKLARDISHRFQDILTRVFFEEDSQLCEFNKRYGVF